MTIPPIYAYPSSPDPDVAPFPWYAAIYGLFDHGDGLLHYVGKSTSPDAKRLKEHIKRANSSDKAPVYHWIRTVLASGREPILKIIEWVPNDDNSRVVQAEADHIATSRHYKLPLENKVRPGGRKGDVLPWDRLAQERAAIPQYPTLFPRPARLEGVNGYRSFSQYDIAPLLWEHMLVIHGDPGRNYIPYKTFIKEDFVGMAATTHPELHCIADRLVYGRENDGWLRRHVCEIIEGYQEGSAHPVM